MLSNISGKELALSPCRLIRWAIHISEIWLVSNNLISQMEKQHLFSCSLTYGYQCCLGKPKQVAQEKQSLQSLAILWDSHLLSRDSSFPGRESCILNLYRQNFFMSGRLYGPQFQATIFKRATQLIFCSRMFRNLIEVQMEIKYLYLGKRPDQWKNCTLSSLQLKGKDHIVLL